MNFIKTTIIGGIVFLVPVGALIFVLANVFSAMLAIAEPMAAIVPIDSVGGVAMANIIAALIVLLICFLAGLLARSAPVRRMAETVENAILQKLPGYSLVKGMTGAISDEQSAQLHPVLVSFGATSRVGIEMEKMGTGDSAVYFPGAPNAWSGVVHIVPSSHIKALDKPISSVIDHVERLGRGSDELMSK